MNILAGIDCGIHRGWYGISPSAFIPGYGPSGVATIAGALQLGYTLTWTWPTDIIPSVAGGEQRIPRNNRPQESFDGATLLFGDEAPDAHAMLAKHAATGATFLLGLPHEALPLSENSIGNTCRVPRTDLSDWMNKGQRVIVVRNKQFVNAVVQDHGADTILLDVAPGALGKKGGFIMPTLAIYLDPKQSFERYRTQLERWKIKAQSAIFGFARTLAKLDLGPITATSGLNLATVTARVAGSTPTFRITRDIFSGAAMHEGLGVVTVRIGTFVAPDVQDVYNLLLSSTLVAPTGTWGAGSMGAGDVVPATELAGGDTAGPVGTGAALTMYEDCPVWDRKLKNSGTNTDSIDGLTQTIDHGSIPYQVALADAPIWSRAVNLSGKGLAAWQWLKLFMVTVRGAAKVFWLSTWRDDLAIVGHAASALTVIGNVKTWYPALREHIHVREADGSNVHCKINAIVDNGNGTFELQTNAAPFTDPVGVSWLELCRFDGESFPVKFGAGAMFEIAWRASAVPQ